MSTYFALRRICTRPANAGFGARSAADNDLPNLIDTVFAAERGDLFQRFKTCYHNDLVHTAAGVQRGKRS